MLMNKSLKIATLAAVVGSALGFSSLASAATEIKAAFNQSDKHPQYQALQEFGQKLSQETDGRYKLTIYPNELLGDQRAALELVQNGAIQMAVVANQLVENYDQTFRMCTVARRIRKQCLHPAYWTPCLHPRSVLALKGSPPTPRVRAACTPKAHQRKPSPT